METNKSKITIEFEGTAIKFGTENCSYEQEAMACKLLDVRLQQKIMGNMAIEIPDKQESDPYDKTYINNYIKERNIFTFEKVMEKFGYSQVILHCQKRV